MTALAIGISVAGFNFETDLMELLCCCAKQKSVKEMEKKLLLVMCHVFGAKF